MAGRYAPSPSGVLHVGNLRTALVAWLVSRSAGEPFYLRIEDLDAATSTIEHEVAQVRDLTTLGLDFDGPVVHQRQRSARYDEVIARLAASELVYPCYCTRREIRDEIERSTRAPHEVLPDGAYPGTCRDLTADDRSERASGRTPALRLRTDGQYIDFVDRIAGPFGGHVDDVVLARADGTAAYNLAVVVDDHDQGIDQVVRGDDLLTSTPRQLWLHTLLDWEPPEYWHVPLVTDGDVRLAKRNGGVTLPELIADGWAPRRVVGMLASSLGLAVPGESLDVVTVLDRFDPDGFRPSSVDVADLVR